MASNHFDFLHFSGRSAEQFKSRRQPQSQPTTGWMLRRRRVDKRAIELFVASIAMWSAGARRLLSIEISEAHYATRTDRASPFPNIEGRAYDERFV